MKLKNLAKLLGEILQNTFWQNYQYKNAAKFGKIHFKNFVRKDFNICNGFSVGIKKISCTFLCISKFNSIIVIIALYRINFLIGI